MAAQRPNPISEDLLARLPESPDSYPQKIDLVRELVLVVQFGLGAYRSASFLDDRILSPATKGAWLPIARVVDASRHVRNPRPLHFIFHTGHVGSTLVSRLLDETGCVLSLREPLPLRTLAEAADVLGQSDSLLSEAQFDALRGMLMRLWSRAYDAAGSVVVKATSSAGCLAAPLLARGETSRAIYLNLRPEPYLATLLAGQNSPVDLRGHGPGRIRRLQSHITVALTPLHALSIGELAAMSWLAESWAQCDALSRFSDRVIAVDFDEFLSNVGSSMERILGHLGLPRDSRYLSEVEHSPVLTRYSKGPEHSYSPQLRAQVLSESRQRNREEIRRGMSWLQQLAKSQTAVAQILNAADASKAEG